MREGPRMQLSFVGCKTLDRYDEGEEDQRKDRKGFGGSCDDSVVPGKQS